MSRGCQASDTIDRLFYVILAMRVLWLLDAAVTLAAAVQAGRIAMHPAVRRELRDHPRGALLLVIAPAGLVFVTLAWIALSWPVACHVLAAVLAGSFAAAWWRARPAYGRSRGLPPGSLGLGPSLDAITDEEFYADASRRLGPILKVSHFHRPVVCVVDLSLAMGLLENEPEAVRQVDWPFDRLVPGGYVEFMDGERHTRFRELLSHGFADSVLVQCQPSFERGIRAALDAMAQGSGPDGVRPEPLVERMALDCLLRVVLGVEVDDPRVAAVPRLLAALDRPINPFVPVPSGMRNAFQRLSYIVGDVAEAIRQRPPGEPRPASVLSEVLRLDHTLAQDPAVIGNLITMVHDGRTMLRRLLLWMLKLSGDHPRWTAQIGTAVDCADPAAVDQLTRHFVLETLRTRMTPSIYRKVVRDVRLGPYRLPKGWLLRICVRETHLRPDVFATPHSFDPSRFAARSFTQAEFCPFSAGPHACFADTFVMAVARMFLIQLAVGFDPRIVRDGPAEGNNRHWTYRSPSTQLRVSLMPRRTPASQASTLVSSEVSTA